MQFNLPGKPVVSKSKIRVSQFSKQVEKKIVTYSYSGVMRGKGRAKSRDRRNDYTRNKHQELLISITLQYRFVIQPLGPCLSDDGGT